MNNKKIIPLLIVPFVLASCKSYNSFNEVKERIDTISSIASYPYYRVVGYLDFNNEITEIDATFDKTPDSTKFVPYARYNDGFYCASASYAEQSYGKDKTVIYSLASKSYWLRAPLRLHKDNFYVLDDNGKENTTCGHYLIEHMITSFLGSDGAINPSRNKMKYELIDDGGFAFIGEATHTTFRIDNYPYYPDVNAHPELGEWDEENPLPCYENQINAKVNVRLEYNKDGWLVREFLKSTDYDYNKSKEDQIALEAKYLYKFE